MRPRIKSTFILNDSSQWNSVATDTVGKGADFLMMQGAKTGLAAQTEM